MAHSIGSGDGDCDPSPSHTTGRAVFRIRRLKPARTSLSVRSSAKFRLGIADARLAAVPLLLPVALSGRRPVGAVPFDFRSLRSFPSVPSLAPSGSFRPSLHPRYRASSLLRRLLTAPTLSRGSSPQVRCKIFPLAPSGSTWCVSDDFWASLFPASSPPAPGLTAGSCSYGRKFATRFFQLHLAVTPCASLRLSSSTPSRSFHLARFCPCWAHWGRPSACGGLPGPASSLRKDPISDEEAGPGDPRRPRACPTIYAERL